MSYLSLFASAFLAATLLPFYSEVVLVTLMMGDHHQGLLWASATLGNTLGACVNWWLGRYLLHFQHKRWFPASKERLEKSQYYFQRYGVWSLLFSWLPVGGDALTLVAGIMRVNFWLFFALVLIGKGARYYVVMLLAQAALPGSL